MLVLVCGSRNWTNPIPVRKRFEDLPKETVIMHGACRGADEIAGEVAREFGFEVKEFPADWDKHGKAAGPIRNRLMLDQKPDLVLAFHEDVMASKGTKDCLREAGRRNISVEVIEGDYEKVKEARNEQGKHGETVQPVQGIS